MFAKDKDIDAWHVDQYQPGLGSASSGAVRPPGEANQDRVAEPRIAECVGPGGVQEGPGASSGGSGGPQARSSIRTACRAAGERQGRLTASHRRAPCVVVVVGSVDGAGVVKASRARQAILDGIVSTITSRTIRRILNEVDLQPHRTRYWRTARLDAQFKDRARKVLWCSAHAERLVKQGIWIFLSAHPAANFREFQHHLLFELDQLQLALVFPRISRGFPTEIRRSLLTQSIHIAKG